MQSLDLTPSFTIGDRTFLRYIEGHTYEDTAGATLYSGADEPSAEDAEDCIQNPRTPPAPPPEPRELSKLILTRRLRAMGKEDAFWAVLDASPVLRREWLSSQVVRTDDPMFTAIAEDLKVAIGLSDVDFAALLAP